MYTPSEAHQARELFMEGWSIPRIARKLNVRRDAVYKWCVLGMHYTAERPDGFEAYRQGYTRRRSTMTGRIDQVPVSFVRQARLKFMAGEWLFGDVQLHIIELDPPQPLTGLESHDVLGTDICCLLLGRRGGGRPYPAGHSSMPRGYAAWLSIERKRLIDEVLDVKAEIGEFVSVSDRSLLSKVLTLPRPESSRVDPLVTPVGQYVPELPYIIVDRDRALPGVANVGRTWCRDFDSALEAAFDLMRARKQQRQDFAKFVTWGEGVGETRNAELLLLEDVRGLAETTGFSHAEAKRLYRLAQEVVYCKRAGLREHAEQIVLSAKLTYLERGVVPKPDTSFSAKHEWFEVDELMTGRISRRARRACVRERRRAIAEAAELEKYARPA